MTENKIEITAAEMLRDARTVGRRKRELSTIAKLLCIREEYLEALESGNYKIIPEVVYILGFARNYAMELGLNPTEITEKIKSEMGIIDENDIRLSPKTEEHSAEEQGAVVQNRNSANKPIKKDDSFHKIAQYLYKNWKWLVAATVAIIIAVVSMSFILSLSSENGAPDALAQPEIVVKDPAFKMDVREKFGTENSANAVIVLQARATSWIKIEDARANTIFSRSLVPGDVYYVPSGDKIKATFGNAGGVDVWVNNVLAPKQGAINATKSGILMTPENLMPAESAPVVE